MELTKKQREVYDLRESQDPPPSWPEIAKQLGKSKSCVSTLYSQARKRLGQQEPEHKAVRSDASEVKNPALVPEVIDRASDPPSRRSGRWPGSSRCRRAPCGAS